MKILLVRPRQPQGTIGLQHIMVVEPLELEVIGALVQPPDDAVIVDLVLERQEIEYFLDAHGPDVVGITGYITTVGVIKDLARRVKARNEKIVTVVGGVHAEVCPDDFDSPHIDYRCVRNATREFPKLIEHLRGCGPCPSGILGRGQGLLPDALPDYDFFYPHPRRDLARRYQRHYFYLYQDHVALLKTSFGCPYECNFCFCRLITHNRYHARDVRDVVDELEALEQREIYIVDDDFLLSQDRVLAFLEEIRKRDIRKHFQVYGRADFIAGHPDVIKEFRRLGLRVVIVGLESFEDDELMSYNKRLQADVNRQAMKVLNGNGIDVYATFILPPDWTGEDFDRLGRTMRRLQIRFANLQPLTPLPGIDCRVEDDELVLRRDEWEKWDLAHVTIRPTRMSVARFYAETINLYKKMIYSPRNLFVNGKYPLKMQWRILRGISCVRRQYEQAQAEALPHA